MPRANGRSIVGQQLPTWLDVAPCVRLHTPLHVVVRRCGFLGAVAQSSKPVKRLTTCKRTQQLPTLLRQECCVRVAVVSKRMQELPPTRDNMQQGVQTGATCNIQQCWELLANNVTLFARRFKMIKNYSQRKSMVLDVVIFSTFIQ